VIWQTRLRHRPPRSLGRGARLCCSRRSSRAVAGGGKEHAHHTPTLRYTYSTGLHAGKKEASRDDRKTCCGRKQGARPAREKEVRGKPEGGAKEKRWKSRWQRVARAHICARGREER
jgi:hypothetical protein